MNVLTVFLCSIQNKDGNWAIVKYKYENQNSIKIIEKENIHEEKIVTFIELDDGTIASGLMIN